MKDLVSKEEYSRLLQDYDTWLFDCDGVLWHGDNLVEGAVEVLSYLRSQSSYRLILSKFVNHLIYILEKQIIFVTNNATKSRRSYKSKFDKLGVQANVVSEFTLGFDL